MMRTLLSETHYSPTTNDDGPCFKVVWRFDGDETAELRDRGKLRTRTSQNWRVIPLRQCLARRNTPLSFGTTDV
jgi:hypothetical protein